MSVERSEAPKAPVFGLAWPVLIPVSGMLFAILMVIAFRVWRLDVPFERDEGEYAYMGQLMLQGVPPYSVAANMKLPGTYAAYALAMALFGQTIRGVHLGYLLVNAGCIVLLYFVARRFLGTIAGVAAAASYAVLSVGAGVDGLWAHATHFVVLFALGATLLLLKWADRSRIQTLIGSGLLYGMAFLMKQPGILFVVFGGLYVIYSQRKQCRGRLPRMARNLALFTFAAMFPLGVTCAILWRAGVIAKFWFWVFTYASQYVSMQPLSDGVKEFMHHAPAIVQFNVVLTIVAAVGLILLWSLRTLRSSAIELTGFLVFSWLAVCPGLYFRPHYFVLVLPAAGLLIGAVARSAGATLAGSLPLWIIALGLADSMWVQRGYLFRMSPVEVMRGTYGLNPFPEAIPVARYIRGHSESSDLVAVLGSEPEIYFYSGRKSATPYLYTGPLIESHPLVARMQEEYIDDVEAWKPKYLVYASCPESWGIPSLYPRGLLAWAKPYYEQYYEPVGVADIGPDETIYKWDGDAAHYRIQSADYLLVLRRKQL